MLRGTFQLMKSVNKKMVLNKIRLEGPISRAEIAKETGITPPTVSSIVKELIEESLVEENSLGESSGGRKPTMLLLKEDGHYVIGIDAGSNQIKAIISDLVGNILVQSEQPTQQNSTTEEFLNKMITVTKEVILACKKNEHKIIGIGVAMHGVIEIDSGVSLYSANSNLRNVPIKETMEKIFNLPVTVENNSRAMAIGEYWFGNYGYIKRFVAINIGRGVGSGIIENNKLKHGAQDVSGEIGHTSISLDGDVCSCGNRGCFETFVTGPAIVRRSKKQIKNAPNELTAEQVYSFALEGNEAYQNILNETGELIGIGIVNLIHTINPDKIVLGGGVMKGAKFLIPSIQKTIQERVLIEKIKNKTLIEISQLGEDATLLGAAALLLTTLFY